MQTIVSFVWQGPQQIFSRYEHNNHMLFNLLTWATTSVVGRSEIAYRLWGAVPAIAAAVTIAWWLWRRLGQWVACVALLLVTLLPLHLQYATQARGYGLATLAAATALIAADYATRSGNTAPFVVFSLAGVVGICTIPVFVLGYVAQALPLTVRHETRRRTVLAVAAAAGICLAFYGPVLLGPDASLVARSSQLGVAAETEQLRWHAPVTAPSRVFVGAIAHELVPGHRDSAASRAAIFVLVFVPLITLAITRLWRSRERLLLAHLAAPVAGVYVAFTAFGSFYRDRFASYLVFHVMTLLALGFVDVVERLGRRPLMRVSLAAGAVVAAALGLFQLIELDQRWDETPAINFQAVGDIVASSGIDDVVTAERAAGYVYYVGRNVAELSPAQLEERFCEDTAAVVFVRRRGDPPVDTSCLERRGATRVRPVQRNRRATLDVWVAPTVSSRNVGESCLTCQT